MGLTQASVFCQLKATMPNLFFEESLFNTAAQRQKYNIFDPTEPILERHSHLTRILKKNFVDFFCR